MLRPAADAVLFLGEPVKAVVKLTLPPGGQLPTFVVVAIKKANVLCGSTTVRPAGEPQGRSYTLECERELTPKQLEPGGYELEAEVIYVYHTVAPDGSEKPHKTTRLHKRIPVQIRLAELG